MTNDSTRSTNLPAFSYLARFHYLDGTSRLVQLPDGDRIQKIIETSPDDPMTWIVRRFVRTAFAGGHWVEIPACEPEPLFTAEDLQLLKGMKVQL